MLLPIEIGTTVTLMLGPIVDSSDGFTPITTSIPAANLKVSKNNGPFVAKSDTNPSVHLEDGWHQVQLNATDTGSNGELILKYYDSGNSLHVWVRAIVLTSNVFRSLWSFTDKLDVNSVEFEGNAPSSGLVSLDLAQLAAPEITVLTTGQTNILNDLAANTSQNGQLLSEHVTLLGDHVTLESGHTDILNAIAGIASGDLNDNIANKQIIAKALKDQDVSVISDVVGSVYKDLKNPLDAIFNKLPSGTISDLTLDTIVDGVTLRLVFELMLAMVDGRVIKDTPNTGDLTFYKRDNTTILTITSSSETERTRA